MAMAAVIAGSQLAGNAAKSKDAMVFTFKE
jgi:hypothetical protein